MYNITNSMTTCMYAPEYLDQRLKVVLSLNKMTIPHMLQVQVSQHNTMIYSIVHAHAYTCILLFTSIVFSMNSPTLVSIQCDKIIVSMPQLLQLVPSTCLHPSCTSKLSHSTQFRGCGVYLHFKCDVGHTYSWSSSDEHLDKRGYSIHSNNLLLSAACLLSGNCFSKISQMLEFMGIKTFSENMYYR